MKTLVVFYSRTGTTRKVAENIAFWLKAQKDEIVDKKSRSGPIGYIVGGKDASTKALTNIEASKYDPADFDCIIIGTPVWAWTMAPAVRTYIEQHKEVLKNKMISIFCTMGSKGGKQTFEEISKMLGIKPKATLALLTRDVVKSNYENDVRDFVKKI